MAAVRVAADLDEGYPSSSEADLEPGRGTSKSLADADRAAGDENRVRPEGQGPDESMDDNDES